MAARRSSKRTRRRRGRFGFLYKALSLVLILAAIVAGCIVFFRVNDVAVSGESKYTAQEIIDVTGVQQGDNLLLLPRNQIVKRILTQLPYVSNVNLRLSLPDTLLISVTECAPAALVQGGEGWWIIDARGKLLEQVSAPTVRPDLAKVTGVTALLPTAGTKLAVAEELDPIIEDHCRRLGLEVAGKDVLPMVDEFSQNLVAAALGGRCVLCAAGHQPPEALRTAGVPVIGTLWELPALLGFS